MIAANQLNIKAGSFTNAGSNVTTGVGSLGNASLITTGVWDAGSNALKVNGVLTANTDGITVAVGKTWEQANVNWSGTLTNLGTTNLGLANGTAINQSSGSIERTDVPNSDPALAGSYHYTATPPVGYSTATLKSYTDVLNRAKFSAVNFTGGLVNIAGDVNLGSTGLGYSALDIAQNVTWFGAPDSNPGATPQDIVVNNDALSKPRADFIGTAIVTLVGPNAGTIIGGNVTINAGDLTVDMSNTGAAQGGINLAQFITVGSIVGSHG